VKLGTVGFVGERLREGRESRGFTAAALSVPAGVSPAAITQYETNLQTPRPVVMDKIQSTLMLPSAFFLRHAEREEGVIYWRSLSSATRLAQMVAERRLGWVQDITAALREHLEFPVLSIPDLGLPRDPLAITDLTIERAASEVRRLWQLGDGPLDNITRILEERGVILAQDDLAAMTLDALSKWCPSERSAFCLCSTGKESAVRSRLNVLHELGHLILHRNLDRWHLENKTLHKLIESQAFKFAGAFALPAESYAADVYSLSLDSFINLKAKWKFAISMQLKRCEALNIGREESLRRLWMHISTRGWRLAEPLDDEIPSEPPRMLADGIRFLRQKNLMSSEQLAGATALPLKDLEELTGLDRGEIDPDVRGNLTVIPKDYEPKERSSGGDARILKFPKSNAR
jgi:Zn-dependent peptidase ImmA (M78 family)/transcriptional regulator with XRE-family HTH domain